MRDLLEFASRGDVRQVVETAFEDPSTQGVVVDLDPLWLALWRMQRTVPEREWPAVVQNFEFLSQLFPFGVPGDRFESEYGEEPAPEAWSEPPLWRELAEIRGFRPDPFIVRVVRRPGREPAEEQTNWRRFEELRIVTETRPVAFLYHKPVRPLVGGVSVGSESRSPGTLGGLLANSSGERFGLTCSHVVGEGEVVSQPAPSDRPRSPLARFGRRNPLHSRDVIGRCVASTVLSPGSNCSLVSPDLNEVDVALVEVRPQVASQLEILDVGQIAGTAPVGAVRPGTLVDVAGKRSGHKRVRIGGVGVLYEFRQGDQTYCFRNTVELRHPSRYYGLFGTFSPPIRPGDSGGWVLLPGASGPEWCGVVLSGDGVTGYSMLAESVSDWLASAGYQGLVPTGSSAT